jgi:GTP cyclohydrolase II
MQHATAQPVKIRLHSEMLRTDVLSTVAYRARCECGWQGPSRDKRGSAHIDASEHNRVAHSTRRY